MAWTPIFAWDGQTLLFSQSCPIPGAFLTARSLKEQTGSTEDDHAFQFQFGKGDIYLNRNVGIA
eukprot:13412269-Ditylum_brightwellii.AAC.1